MSAMLSLDEDVVAGIRKAAGYHNYFRAGLYEAVAHVQRSLETAGLDGGWRACSLRSEHDEMPDDAIRVGQVCVHHGDPSFPLIIRRIPKGGE